MNENKSKKDDYKSSKHHNSDYYLSLVKKTPEAVWDIPKKYRNKTICKEAIIQMGYKKASDAVKNNPKFFDVLPPSLYDHESCLEYVNSDYFKTIVEIVPKQGSLAYIGKEELSINHGRTRSYTISLNKLLNYYDVCKKAVTLNREFIGIVPEKLMTEELCVLSINADANSFCNIPKSFMNKSLCELACQKEPANIKKVPVEFITNQMCIDAVQKSGLNLKYVPDELKTYDMCWRAVSDEGEGIDYIPERLFNKKIALYYIEKAISNKAYSFLSKIPESLRDYEVCFSAVSKKGEDLRYVPEEIKDYNLCLQAARNSAQSVNYIPNKFLTPELCLELMKHSSYAINYLPKECLTYEACLEAVKHGRYTPLYKEVISLVPAKLLTEEICFESVKESTGTISEIPEEYVSERILYYLAEHAPGLLDVNFPSKYKTAKFINGLIEKYPDSKRYIEGFIENN